MNKLRVAIAQLNTTVGDISGNTSKAMSYIEQADKKQSDIIIFPELTITGYPPEDLLFRKDFIQANLHALNEIVEFSKNRDMLIVIGFVDSDVYLYNAAATIYKGEIIDIYHKIRLPNYGVFDEKRYFKSGNKISIIKYKNIRIGITICEDIWYPKGPDFYEALSGDAEMIVNISASPYTIGKNRKRTEMMRTKSKDNIIKIAYCNLVGGQDELVFDGNSMIIDEKGAIVAKLHSFTECLDIGDVLFSDVLNRRLKDINIKGSRKEEIISPYKLIYSSIDNAKREKIDDLLFQIGKTMESEEEEIFNCLVCGTEDYIRKNGFKHAIIAISGGIDSAIVAVIAVKALGSENVTGIFMPSQFTESISKRDAKKLCNNLGIELIEKPIEPIFNMYLTFLNDIFKDLPFGVAEENLQARIRGNLVMALSNKFGWLVLTTGNKSEMSVGYATLYGDMAGGFAVIKDVTKTCLYKIANWVNERWDLIPESIIERPPTAELRPNQKDTDSLPPYEILDPILKAYIEEDKSKAEIESMGYDKSSVNKVINLIIGNEYKRRQAPVGIKITERSFGRDRRYPITNKFKPPK
ncbi:NAD+ synthase [candidate division WOR-3 bacterium]|nr:NAD+ synthase [candidate division WOR-3 bacterium]